MNPKLFAAVVAHLTLATALTSASEPSLPGNAAGGPGGVGAEVPRQPVCWRNGLHVTMANLVGRNDVVYLSPARYEHEAMPVGNGRLCAMVWNATGLDLQLNHADNVAYQSGSGRVRLVADADLFDGLEQFEQRQSLYDGTIRTRFRGKAGQWTSVVTVLDELDVVAIHFEGRVQGRLRLELEQWRPSAKPVAGGLGFVEDLPMGDKQFSRRQALVAAADCDTQATEPRVRDSLAIIPIELKPRAGRGGNVSFTVYVANVFTSGEADPAARANEALASARRFGWQKNSKRAAASWARFWDRSFVHLTSPEGTADYLENLWFLHLDWMNCAGRGEMPVKFNGGPFLVHRDLRDWGNGYWYQNTRELYWPLLAADHLELCKPLDHLYRSVLPVEMEMTKRFFKVDGAQYQETMTIDGNGDKESNGYTCLYLSTGMEITLQLYREYLYSRDEQFLKDTVWPMLRETARFYLNWVRKEADGLYHVYPTNGKETWWRVKDAITDLAAMRRMFPICIELSQRLGVDHDLAARCEEVLRALPPYPIDPEKGGWAPCVCLANPPDTGNPGIERIYPPQNTSHSLKENKNSENIECEVIFPWELVGQGADAKDLAMARKTFRDRRWQPAGGWDEGAVWAARLGDTPQALLNVVLHAVSGQRWPQGFYNTPGGLYTAGVLFGSPGLDPAGVNALSTTEMLLQSWDGRIRVWPAVPDNWTGVFRLRAQTGFLVTSERRGGSVAYVAVESLFGDLCRIVNPWKDTWIVSRDGKEIARGLQDEIVFPTTKGKTYLVYCSVAPVARMPFAPLVPAINQNVKRLPVADVPEASRGIEMPILGITRDGWTPVRMQIRLNHEAGYEAIHAVIGDRKPLPIAAARATDTTGALCPAPWLIDGIFGIDQVPPALNYASYAARIKAPYVLELSTPAPVQAVAWSCDRRGVRSDFGYALPSLKIVVVETSPDGTIWSLAAQATPDTSMWGLYGQAIRIEKPVTAKLVRISFRQKNGDPMQVPVDELEVY